MTLQEFFVWLLSGGGAGIVAYWLMERIGNSVEIDTEMKRYLSLALSGLVATGAYVFGVWIGYEPQPETAIAWIEAIFAVIAVAIGFSQAIHGRLKLRSQDTNG